MWCRLAVIFMILKSCLTSADHFLHHQGPCNFIDTINITSGHPDQNGNFHHNGVIYKKGTFLEYNYVVEDFTKKVEVEKHIRGCVCLYKACIRLCCTDTEDANSTCIKTESINVPTQDDEEEEIDLNGKTYGVLTGRPCRQMYKLEPAQYEYDRWIFSVSSGMFLST